jgi:chromosome segregation ATPase
MSNNSNLFLSIGKPIKDEYGRTVGKVACFALTPSGKFDGVYIESNNGTFSKKPMDHLKFNGAEVTFTSTLKSQSSVLCDQIPLIWRKDQALKELAEKRKISPNLYQELHNNFEGVLKQLKTDAKELVDEASQEIARCDQEIKTLGYAVVNLELEHEIGQIDDEAYESAFTLLQENLKRVNMEKTDIIDVKSKISNILLGDSQKTEQKTIIENTTPLNKEILKETIKEPILDKKIDEKIDDTKDENSDETPNDAPELPEPPVVVYVKEVGKAGI